jgi:hypothetical protein
MIGISAILSICCGCYVIATLAEFRAKNRATILRFSLFLLLTGLCVLGYIALTIYFLVAFVVTPAQFLLTEYFWVFFVELQCLMVLSILIAGRSLKGLRSRGESRSSHPRSGENTSDNSQRSTTSAREVDSTIDEQQPNLKSNESGVMML